MAIGQFTKRVTTFLSGRTLKMFRYDCVDSDMGVSTKLKQIINNHYRNQPPRGFKNETNDK